MIDFPSFKITQDKNRDYQGVILTGGRPIMTWTIHQNPPWSRNRGTVSWSLIFERQFLKGDHLYDP